MRNIIILFLLFSCSLSSTNQNMHSWKLIKARGLNRSNEKFHKMLFVNDKIGFLFGTNYTDDVILNKRFDKQNAVIYRTSDGGENWTEANFGYGSFVDATKIQGSIFAICNHILAGFSSFVDSSTVFASSDNGSNWAVVCRLPRFIRDIKFTTARTGIAVTKDLQSKNDNWEVLKTNNGGKSWENLFQEKNLSNPVIVNNEIFYLSEENEGSTRIKKLVKRSIDGCVKTFEDLPSGFNVLFFYNLENQLWIFGQDENRVAKIYRKDSNESFKLIKDFKKSDLFPYYFNVYGNSLLVILGEMTSSSVKYKVYGSQDSGNNWNEEYIPIFNYLNPIANYNQMIWIYSGAGRIQERNIEIRQVK